MLEFDVEKGRKHGIVYPVESPHPQAVHLNAKEVHPDSLNFYPIDIVLVLNKENEAIRRAEQDAQVAEQEGRFPQGTFSALVEYQELCRTAADITEEIISLNELDEELIEQIIDDLNILDRRDLRDKLVEFDLGAWFESEKRNNTNLSDVSIIQNIESRSQISFSAGDIKMARDFYFEVVAQIAIRHGVASEAIYALDDYYHQQYELYRGD